MYKLISFPNATDDDEDVYYFTTITFSESTQLRKGSDYIIIYKDNQHTDVYGDSMYSGTDFPGKNGAAALGFVASQFIFHFHSSAGEIPTDYGYQMTVTISKQLRSAGSKDSIQSTSGYMGLSRSGMISLISFLVILACVSCCGLPFWYLQARASAKVASEAQERRRDKTTLSDDIEANDPPKEVERSKPKKGKSSKYLEEEEVVEIKKVKSPGTSPVVINVGPPMQFTCSISCEIMDDPVICADGFTYDRCSIEPWLTNHNTSPMTNIELPNKTLIPNLALKEIIVEYKSNKQKLARSQL